MTKIQAIRSYTDNELKELGTYEVERKGEKIDLKDGLILKNDIYEVKDERAKVIIERNLAVILKIEKQTKKGGKK